MVAVCHPRPPPKVRDCHPLIQTRNPSGKLKTRNPLRADRLGSGSRGREGDQTLPAARPNDALLEDLKDTGRLLDLLRQAIDRGLIGSSEADRLRFVAAAEHALAVGTANPPGLFAYLVRGRCWRYITQADEDRANARIKRTSGARCHPRRQHCRRSALSEDARMVLEIRVSLERAGYRGHPFPAPPPARSELDPRALDLAEAELAQAGRGR